MILSACSTSHEGVGSRSELVDSARQESPVGTFVGPPGGAVIKVRLDSNGTYIAEDIGPPEYWIMAEGNKFYPQRIKFRPQRGHWTSDSRTGQLTLIPETAASFRWNTKHLRYDRSNPNRLAWGEYAFLARVNE
jgi:hypothetical protein